MHFVPSSCSNLDMKSCSGKVTKMKMKFINSSRSKLASLTGPQPTENNKHNTEIQPKKKKHIHFMLLLLFIVIIIIL